MVLLAVITVGTLSLSVVTLRTGTQDSAKARAQANARMALMVAIGELQRHTGADTRVTASANIVDKKPFFPRPPVYAEATTGRPVRSPALSTAFTPKANSSSESKFLAAGGSDGNITIAVTQGAGSTADYDRITVTIPATYLAGHPKTFARLMTNLIP
jgi:type II secretory pathway pseudopilin PulG